MFSFFYSQSKKILLEILSVWIFISWQKYFFYFRRKCLFIYLFQLWLNKLILKMSFVLLIYVLFDFNLTFLSLINPINHEPIHFSDHVSLELDTLLTSSPAHAVLLSTNYLTHTYIHTNHKLQSAPCPTTHGEGVIRILVLMPQVLDSQTYFYASK